MFSGSCLIIHHHHHRRQQQQQQQHVVFQLAHDVKTNKILTFREAQMSFSFE